MPNRTIRFVRAISYGSLALSVAACGSSSSGGSDESAGMGAALATGGAATGAVGGALAQGGSSAGAAGSAGASVNGGASSGVMPVGAAQAWAVCGGIAEAIDRGDFGAIRIAGSACGAGRLVVTRTGAQADRQNQHRSQR
ncbi:MAG: hypothetical protein ABUL62_02485 [Myxococcales bacterium]